jgi:hypothetical protein
VSESIPERQASIMREQNISFGEVLRIAFAESRIERVKLEKKLGISR